MTDHEAPGWAAIDRALATAAPGVEPLHYGTLIKHRLGGPDPLDGISFYPLTEPVPHWHVVGYGLSELYAKESGDAEWSGWGFEFTFRLRRSADDTDPPLWAANLMQNLSRYVFQTGNEFAPGHHMDLNGPMRLDADTLLRALAFAEDPALGTVETPHGKVTFLQLVGLTSGEYTATQTWSTDEVLKLIAARHPLLITDLSRPSLTDDPAFVAAVAAGRARDGSSTGSIAVDRLTWSGDDDGLRVTVGAHAAGRVAAVLLGRLPHGRGLLLSGPSASVGFRPGEEWSWTGSEGLAELTLPPTAGPALAWALSPQAGVRAVPGLAGLTVEVTD